MTTTPIRRTHRETLAHLKALKEPTMPETPARDDDYTPEAIDRDGIDLEEATELAHTNVPELAAAVRHLHGRIRNASGMSTQRLQEELQDAVNELAEALMENGLDREAADHEVLDIARGTQTIASTNARLAALRAERDAEQSPTEDEEIAARMEEERETYDRTAAETDEPTTVAAFLRAMVTEVTQTSGHETRRSVLRTMAEAGYPHLVRSAMGDLLTVVANYATDNAMVQALRQDTEAAFAASARKDAQAQDAAEERIYRNGGPNP